MKIGAVLILAVLCGSCSPGFSIRPSGVGSNIQLSFSKKACVARLGVQEENWPTRASGRPVWAIKAAAGCVPLRRVIVGQVPAGFIEEVNVLPLNVGNMYGAFAIAEPETGLGMSMPWFVCEGAPATVEWENDQRLKAPSERCRP